MHDEEMLKLRWLVFSGTYNLLGYVKEVDDGSTIIAFKDTKYEDFRNVVNFVNEEDITLINI